MADCHTHIYVEPTVMGTGVCSMYIHEHQVQVYMYIVHNQQPTTPSQQSGAVGACWAHNPEVDGSKPFSATFFFLNITKI